MRRARFIAQHHENASLNERSSPRELFGTTQAPQANVILTILRMKSAASRTKELLQALRSVMRPAHAEKGFIGCQLYLDAENDSTICYEEQWTNREDLEEQVRSPRFTLLLDLMESAKEQPSLEFHFVAETRGLEYVAAVRGEDSPVTPGVQSIG